jgi:Bacterial PH domain
MQPEQGQGAGRPDGKAAGQRVGQAIAASPPAGQGVHQPPDQRVHQPAGQRVQQPAGKSAHQPGEQKMFRMPGAIFAWWTWVIFAVACLADIAFTGRDHTAAEIAMTLVFITGLVYACALRPRVVADADGVTVQNPLRDHRIPWGSVTAVDLRESVQVHCAREPGAKRGRVIHSWALYAHRRHRLKADLLTQGNDRRRLPRSSLTPYGEPSAREQKKPSPAELMASQLDEMASEARERGAAPGPRVVTWPWPPAVAIAAPAIALVLVITLFH